MKNMELRVLPSDLQFSNDNEDLIVEGLVNRTESWSHELGIRKKFKERILKGAFNRAIQENPRIDFLGEHRADQLLATTENGSLKLWEDEEGLKMRAKIAPTSYGKDFYTLMKNGLVNHMSFGFRSLSDNWKKLNDGTYERSIESLVLSEVSVVRNPAYPQSAISARGINVVEDVEIPQDVEIEKVEGEKEMDLKEIENSIRSLQNQLEKLKKNEETEETSKDEKVDVIVENTETEENIKEVSTENVGPKEEEVQQNVGPKEMSAKEERNFMVDIFEMYRELQKHK